MASLKAFTPLAAVSVTAAAGSSAVGSIGTSGDALRVVNTTNGVAYLKFGVANTVAASIAAGGWDIAMASGSTGVFTVPGVTWVAVILSVGATSGPVLFMRGEGMGG